jgi:hypothetical protein
MSPTSYRCSIPRRYQIESTNSRGGNANFPRVLLVLQIRFITLE